MGGIDKKNKKITHFGFLKNPSKEVKKLFQKIFFMGQKNGGTQSDILKLSKKIETMRIGISDRKWEASENFQKVTRFGLNVLSPLIPPNIDILNAVTKVNIT